MLYVTCNISNYSRYQLEIWLSEWNYSHTRINRSHQYASALQSRSAFRLLWFDVTKVSAVVWKHNYRVYMSSLIRGERHDRIEAKGFSALRPTATAGTSATLPVVQYTLGRRSASISRTKNRMWRTRHATTRQSHCKSKISCRQSSMILSRLLNRSWKSR